MKTNIEKILGGAIQSTAYLGVEGLKDRSGHSVIFFEVSLGESPGQTFRKLTNAVHPPHAKNGAAVEYGCAVKVPTGLVFHALGIHGDVEGWKKDIELGAAHFGLALARLVGDTIVVNDDRAFQIPDCAFEFF